MSILLERVRSWRSRRARVLLCEGGARLACWSLAAVSAAVWLDKLALLPQTVRSVVWLAAAAGLLRGAVVLLWRPWRGNSWGVVLDEDAIDRQTRYNVNLFLHGLLPQQNQKGALEHKNQQIKKLLTEAVEQLDLVRGRLTQAVGTATD